MVTCIRLHHLVHFSSLAGWVSNADFGQHYLKIDLRRVYEVTAITTQGATWGSTKNPKKAWVTEYTLLHSLDDKHWTIYSGNRTERFGKRLRGNFDEYSVVTRRFHQPFLVRPFICHQIFLFYLPVGQSIPTKRHYQIKS